MKSKVVLSAIAVFGLVQGAYAYDFAGMVPGSRRAIAKQIEVLRTGFAEQNPKLVAKLMTSRFVWNTSNNLQFRPVRKNGKLKEYGKREYWKSINNLPKDRLGVFFKPANYKKVSDTEFLVLVDCRFQIRKGNSDVDNIKWTAKQRWLKVDGEWKLKEVSDRGNKLGFRNISYDTNPEFNKHEGNRRRARG